MNKERDRQRDYSDYTQIRLWFFPLSTSSSTTVFQICFTSKDPKTLGMFRKGKSPVTMAKFSKIISGLLPLGTHQRSQNAVAFHASRTEFDRKSWCCYFLCSCCWCKVHQLVSISPSHNIL